ncbi:MAG: IS4 family transposase, partial [Betaproteobacteria bacterium]|nr:IS4 family transposase [Betaproteobacteria bacterium]
SLYEILQILSLTMFETTPINQLLPNASTNLEPPITPIQGVLL